MSGQWPQLGFPMAEGRQLGPLVKSGVLYDLFPKQWLTTYQKSPKVSLGF